MKILRSLPEMIEQLRGERTSHRTIGFVPTMGALHAGHASLLNAARSENQIAVCSIFVNPTQFDDPSDLEKYPKNNEGDELICREAGLDYLLYPSAPEIYADSYRYKVSETELSQGLCGAHRPGHFDGVLTVVLKLLNIVNADRAYFGEKDFQQLTLIKNMCSAFFHSTQIVGCPTLRESDGLAMSSRNARLTPEDRIKAVRLYHWLKQAESSAEAQEALVREGFSVDYVTDEMSAAFSDLQKGICGRRLAAVRLGAVRLIDNVALYPSKKENFINRPQNVAVQKEFL